MKSPFTRDPSRVCSSVVFLWDSYDPTVEIRVVQDASRLISGVQQPLKFYVHGSVPVAQASIVSRLLTRFGAQVFVGTPEDVEDILVVVVYTHGVDRPELPDDLVGADMKVRNLKPVFVPETMQKVDTSPKPDEVFVDRDGTPRFRSRVPQGVPSTMALDPWMWNPVPQSHPVVGFFAGSAKNIGDSGA